MAEPLLTGSIAAPGFSGLNTQESGITLSSGFATIANNCVIDKFGRIGARKGKTLLTTIANADLGSNPIEAMHELVKNDGDTVVLAAGNTKLFTYSGTALTTLTYNGGGVAPTITDNNWTIVSLNGKAYFFQLGHDPLIYDPAASGDYERIAEAAGYTGSVPAADIAISAYGRLWVASTTLNKQIVTWSDLQDGTKWTAGSSGSLDLTAVWPYGTDEITGLAAHNNFLIIFGRRQILIYTNAKDPTNLTLNDTISGIGCVSKFSIQSTGIDVVFLSDGGVRSLLRTIQEKSLPMRDISKNVRDDLVRDVAAEVPEDIRAVYSDTESFYLLSLPSRNIVYCFDMRMALQDGAARTTLWDSYNAGSFLGITTNKLLIGIAGGIAEYSGYQDDGATYRMAYYTNYFDFGEPSSLKVLKKINVVTIGGSAQTLVVKWAFDYLDQYSSRGLSLPASSFAEYGISEYGIGEYSGGVFLRNTQISVGGTGTVVQIGFESDINGAALSIQKIDVAAKQGRQS